MIRSYTKSTNNSLRIFKENRVKSTKAMRKLSSGLRINSAADDAAGLAISDKMKAQIRGLSQAERNIEDGVSLLQVAEGGMNEINSILQRVRELGVQAGNDTNTEEDRFNIQLEVDNLLSEVDNITDTTEFNGIKVLKGEDEFKGSVQVETVVGNMPAWTQPIPDRLTPTKVGTFIKNDGTVVDRINSIATIDFSKATAANIKDLVGNGFYSTCCTCTEKYSIKFVDGNPKSTGSPNPIIEIDISKATNAVTLVREIERQATPYMTHFTKIVIDQNDPKKIQIVDPRISALPDVSKDLGIVGAGVVETKVTVTESKSNALNIQLGANSGQNIKIPLPNTSCDKLNITKLSMGNFKEASKSISKIDEAITIVSGERVMVGSYQNRLNYSLNNASNTGENLQSSESKITDADMAKSILEYSKNSILEQAIQAMLSQTKSGVETVKNLLTT